MIVGGHVFSWIYYELKYYYRVVKFKYKKRIELKHYNGKKVLDIEHLNKWIYDKIIDGKPFFVGRLGGNECLMVTYWERNSMFPFRTDARADRLRDLCKGAGFFPQDINMGEKFVRLMEESLGEIDLIGAWNLYMEEYLLHAYAKKPEVTFLEHLEPWQASLATKKITPWSDALRGKKVLLIHPFAESIKEQYSKKRIQIFANLECDGEILPEFELEVLPAVQSINGTKTEFSNWFEALEYMIDECKRIDFDIAIVGCGAYGFPLAAAIKKMGKSAIHLGGATQLMFGIRGVRWDKHENDLYREMVNEAWCRPMESEKPQKANEIEGGCYW